MTARTQATLLFTAYFSKTTDKLFKPLSITEWNKFVRWQQMKELSPEVFLGSGAEKLLADWNDQGISKNRLQGLLERKAALGIALDRWTRAGVWIINRGEQDYPAKIKEMLKGQAPSIFFGVGNKELLQKHYVGVVGSRAADELDLERSMTIGQQMVRQKYGIVSGGAKGVDEMAMLGALKAGGSSVGIMSDSLIKKSASAQYRNYILSGQLALISPYNPEAGFNAGNAMSRNRLIYTMSDFSIVVKSDIKGGTWEGAKENLKNDWVPLWVCENEEKGNREIVKLGARLLTDLTSLATESLKNPVNESSQTAMFERVSNYPTKPAVPEKIINQVSTASATVLNENSAAFYMLFLTQWQLFFKSSPVTREMLCNRFVLTTEQVAIWLEQALLTKSVLLEAKDGIDHYLLLTPPMSL
jgi:predicted Rossmann fold nucleotide-binding protein DprA/Smf involved in DNA uptake